MKKVNVGSAFEEGTNQGPQNSKVQYDKILGYIESGKEEGANLHLGGNRIEKQGGGYFVEPTIFTDVKPHMKVSGPSIQTSAISLTHVSDRERRNFRSRGCHRPLRDRGGSH